MNWVKLTMSKYKTENYNNIYAGPDIWINLSQVQSMTRMKEDSQWPERTDLWPQGATYQDLVRVDETPEQILSREFRT